ncbi:RDD family protein [Rhodopseudomonas palustris]|uniref:RDD family protein n=1 Tax=Rhodopseudomonas palustris TaxID=1076 RepID=A0A418VRF7_RHOPL|nr:RDD family protein [Rhodopseudomonas palustris]RJF78933.1 RDD family protein [Rhodopseudomonas palustris]
MADYGANGQSGSSAGWRSAGPGDGGSRGGYEQPAAFDGWRAPELFEGVLTKRVFAFMIDFVVLAVPVILACVFIAVFGVVTLGLGWTLFWIVSPASVIWALVYYGASLGGPHSATLGMRAMGIELVTWSGEPGYFVLGAVHAFLFWLSVSMLTPLVLLVGLFNGRRRLLHDIVLGTVIINSTALAAQPARP